MIKHIELDKSELMYLYKLIVVDINNTCVSLNTDKLKMKTVILNKIKFTLRVLDK